ncbi:hypothetical protein [Caudoviricetes sp.]|nr:hypothetical protein [Caudoviricetes sp.]
MNIVSVKINPTGGCVIEHLVRTEQGEQLWTSFSSLENEHVVAWLKIPGNSMQVLPIE